MLIASNSPIRIGKEREPPDLSQEYDLLIVNLADNYAGQVHAN